MATKVFSSRADEASLAYAERVAREQFGMSFGQYCGSILVEAVRQGAKLPRVEPHDEAAARASAITFMKSLGTQPHDASIAQLGDAQVKNLIASRYE